MSGLALWLAVGALGGIGALARFTVAERIAERTGGRFALGTLAVNLSGTFVLGLLSGAGLGGDGYLLAGTATLGSYTTFSTWIFEAERDGVRREHAAMAANLIISLLLGLGAAWLGRAIA